MMDGSSSEHYPRNVPFNGDPIYADNTHDYPDALSTQFDPDICSAEISPDLREISEMSEAAEPIREAAWPAAYEEYDCPPEEARTVAQHFKTLHTVKTSEFKNFIDKPGNDIVSSIKLTATTSEATYDVALESDEVFRITRTVVDHAGVKTATTQGYYYAADGDSLKADNSSGYTTMSDSERDRVWGTDLGDRVTGAEEWAYVEKIVNEAQPQQVLFADLWNDAQALMQHDKPPNLSDSLGGANELTDYVDQRLANVREVLPAVVLAMFDAHPADNFELEHAAGTDPTFINETLDYSIIPGPVTDLDGVSMGASVMLVRSYPINTAGEMASSLEEIDGHRMEAINIFNEDGMWLRVKTFAVSDYGNRQERQLAKTQLADSELARKARNFIHRLPLPEVV